MQWLAPCGAQLDGYSKEEELPHHGELSCQPPTERSRSEGPSAGRGARQHRPACVRGEGREEERRRGREGKGRGKREEEREVWERSGRGRGRGQVRQEG
eukprot:scaffold212309_cov37-Tisochrysis_lutea.AAC.2